MKIEDGLEENNCISTTFKTIGEDRLSQVPSPNGFRCFGNLMG